MTGDFGISFTVGSIVCLLALVTGLGGGLRQIELRLDLVTLPLGEGESMVKTNLSPEVNSSSDILVG